MNYPTPDFTTAIIKYCRLSPAAQNAALLVPEARSHLCSNEYTTMDETVWKAAYGKRPLSQVNDALELIDRPLTQAQIQHVIDVETRATPLNKLVAMHRLSQAQMDTAISKKKCGQSVASELVEAGVATDKTFDQPFRRKLVQTAGGNALLTWLATAEEATEADAIEAFVSYEPPAGIPTRQHRRKLAAVVERFPNVLPVCVAQGSPGPLLSIACGSRHLTDETLQHQALEAPESHGDVTTVGFAWIALANLPVAQKSTIERIAAQQASDRAASAAAERLRKFDSRPTVAVPYDQIEDQGVISWLVGRVCSFISRRDDTYTPPKPFELIALSANPHLSYDAAKRIAADLQSYEVEEAAGALAERAFHDLGAKFDQQLVGRPQFNYRPTTEYTVRNPRDITQPSGFNAELLVTMPATTKVGAMRNMYRCAVHQFVESLEWPAEKWSLLFELAPNMTDMPVDEFVDLAGSF